MWIFSTKAVLYLGRKNILNQFMIIIELNFICCQDSRFLYTQQFQLADCLSLSLLIWVVFIYLSISSSHFSFTCLVESQIWWWWKPDLIWSRVWISWEAVLVYCTQSNILSTCSDLKWSPTTVLSQSTNELNSPSRLRRQEFRSVSQFLRLDHSTYNTCDNPFQETKPSSPQSSLIAKDVEVKTFFELDSLCTENA